MKRAYLGFLVGLILNGSAAYAQMGMRSGTPGGAPANSGNSGVIEHALPTIVRGDPSPQASLPAQRNMGDPRGIGHPGIVGDRGSDGRRESGLHGDFGDRHIELHGRHFDHHFVRGCGVVIFAYGVPYYYYPDYGYYDLGPYSAADSSMGYTTTTDTQTEQYAPQDADSYYQPGFQWGGELKLYHVTMDQFVTYLKTYILIASPVQQSAFRTGFIAHFGADGQPIYDQAMRQAIQQS
jgi:hypothetical protein